MNKNLMKSIMVLHEDTNNALAEVLGISPSTLSQKINESNGAEFNQGEIKMIIDRYQLTAEQISQIFFA